MCAVGRFSAAVPERATDYLLSDIATALFLLVTNETYSCGSKCLGFTQLRFPHERSNLVSGAYSQTLQPLGRPLAQWATLAGNRYLTVPSRLGTFISPYGLREFPLAHSQQDPCRVIRRVMYKRHCSTEYFLLGRLTGMITGGLSTFGFVFLLLMILRCFRLTYIVVDPPRVI